MEPKPELYRSDYGTWFQDPLVVEAYPARPPYPAALLAHLASLAVDEPRTGLDVGCGTGDLARPLAPLLQRVDAVDASEGMLAVGRAAPGGDAMNLRWLQARVEDADPLLEPPYALITAGESLHWFEWDVVMPRFASMLTEQGVLAIVGRNWEGPPDLREHVLPILKRFNLLRVWYNVDLLDELQRRGLFEVLGEQRFGPEPWQPTLDEYVLARHSQRSFSRSHMGSERVAEFDAALRQVLVEHVPAQGGRLQLSVTGSVCWGRPRG